MYYIPQERYLAPKWQARVTPSSKAFRFNNGVIINNLWELKQALRILREDVIAEHVNDTTHDLADWVEHVVGNRELSEELKKTTHRWGLIVALEREMMRTLNLPHYVAVNWLKEVDLPFYFVDGHKASSLEELKKVLDEVSDETVAFHLEREPNDIAKWVDDVTGDYLLAEILAEATNRSQMQIFVSDHLVMLQDAVKCK